MKKTRYIPYGYTIRNGKTVIEHTEADVIREIFEDYTHGSSLKAIADMLTERKVPYTEKTAVWDKARIARIIENGKYIGEGDYDPIIEEELYANALRMKTARQTYQTDRETEAIALIRPRVKCTRCNSPMLRHIRTRDKVKESWMCTNPECGLTVRISDGHLLNKITILMNRIIENAELMQPHPKTKYTDSPTVQMLQADIDREITSGTPSEEYIIDKIGAIASELYRDSTAKQMIAARIAIRRVRLMHPQESFNGTYFTDLISYLTIDENKRITLHTKTETEITEKGEEENGSTENS